MKKIVLDFDNFINEDLNFTYGFSGIVELEDRWFFYNEEDDIIYGADDIPTDNEVMFAFNPKSCEVVVNGKKKNYDVNNPICLIKYDLDKEKLEIYTDYALEYLHQLGIVIESIMDITSSQYQKHIIDKFEDDIDTKHILIYGNQMIASTFDVIEEN